MWEIPDVAGGPMSNRITIDDLASDSGAASAAGEAAEAAADAAADEDTGKWMLELYERLQDDGMLQAIMFGPDAIPDEKPPEDVDASALEDGAGDGGVDVDAEVVADALEDVKNTVGDLQLSQLIKLARENPGLVDDLLEEKLAGAGGGADHAGDVDDQDGPSFPDDEPMRYGEDE